MERLRYEIRVKVQDTPNDLPLILGDLLYCLRSALDQTVWQLAKLTTSYPDGTQFPIFDRNNAKTRRSFASYTAGVPAGAAQLIESLQPYNRAEPETHLLWRLNRLCNIDKHRRVPVHSSQLVFQFPDFPKSSTRFLEFDESQEMVSVPLNMKSQMGFDPDVSFNVVFGDLTENVSADLDGISKIYEFVADSVIPRFARFFK